MTLSVARRRLLLGAAALVVLVAGAMPAAANDTAQTLPFAQSWTDTGLITVNDDWSGVPGIVGYRGDDGTAATGTDPQTVLADLTDPGVVDVNANQTSPNTFFTGGVAEFHLTDPTVALNGSGTADAPFVLVNLSTSGSENVTVSYNLRDLDGSADNAVQQVALHYRIGSTGSWTNLAAGYVADATTGPSLATLVTPVSVTLPAAAEDQPLVQVRVLTTNAVGNDEWVGVDDISVSGATIVVDSAPAVTTTSPADGATGVLTGTNVTVNFTEPVSVDGESWYTISCSATGTHTGTTTGGPTSYTIDPAGSFATGETCTVTVLAAGVSDVDTDDPPDSMASDHTFSFTTYSTIPIGAVQGSVGDLDNGLTHRSTYAPSSGNSSGTTQVAVQGVVHQLYRSGNNRGFFIQNTAATADGDPTSSDGIFVFMGGSTSIGGGYAPQVGDEIVIRGRVAEFNFLTQLTSTSLIEKVGAFLSLDTVVPAQAADPPVVLSDANRYWERREGMRLAVPAGSLAVDGVDRFGADAEQWVMRADSPVAGRTDPYARRVFRDPHPLDDVVEQLFDNGNGYRIMLGAGGLKGAANDPNVVIAPLRTYDTITNTVVGGLYFSFGKYGIQIVEQPLAVPGVDPALNAPPSPAGPGEYAVANYNVENLYDYRDDPFDGCDFVGNAGCPGVNPPFNYVPASEADYQQRLGQLAQQIVQDAHAPDLLLVQEAEDQDICTVTGGSLTCVGPNNADGKPDTLQELALAISAAGGPVYDAAYDRDGADDRGIVAAFMYRTDTVQLLPAAADHPVLGSSPAVSYRGDALAYNTHVQNPKALNADLPSDVDLSTGSDGTNVYTRAPQVGLFRVWRNGVGNGVWVDVHAISNHFSSSPDRRVGQRTEQSAYNAAIATALGADARVVSGGDFNVYPRPDDPFPTPNESDQLGPLYEIGLESLWERVADEVPVSAYGYVFQGQTQTLDNQFVDEQLGAEVVQARYAHVNSDFPADYADDGPRGLSDHDPLVARIVVPVTFESLGALLTWCAEQGQVTGNNTVKQLQHHLDKRQVGPFINQTRGKTPQFVSQSCSDALVSSAQALG